MKHTETITLPLKEYHNLISFAKQQRDLAQHYLSTNNTSPIPEIFSKNEIDIIIETIKRSKSYRKDQWGQFQRMRDLMLVTTQWTFALRPSEVRQLKMTDFKVGEEGTTLHIRPETNKERKGRGIEVPDDYIDLLKEYLSFPKAYFWQGSEYLFPSFHFGPMAGGTWRYKFRCILREAGLYSPPRKGLNSGAKATYSIRHARATYLLEKGASLFELQKLLGHSTTDCTMVYAHMTKTTKHRQKSMLSNPL